MGSETAATRRGPTPPLSPVVKQGQLVHQLPPTEGSGTESACCIPAQAVAAALTGGSISGAVFVLFYRKTRLFPSLRSKPASAPSGGGSPTASEMMAAGSGEGSSTAAAVATQLRPSSGSGGSLYWGLFGPRAQQHRQQQQPVLDVVSGHSFCITPRGSVMYCGRERRVLESTFVARWIAEGSTLMRLQPLASSRTEYRFALHGPGNHTSSFKTFAECNGKGSWRRLLGCAAGTGVVGRDGKATHVVHMQLPEVLAHMVALGVRPTALAACLKQGEFGTLRLDFEPGPWTTPEERNGGLDSVLQDPDKAWRLGWWYTGGQGMGVWVC